MSVDDRAKAWSTIDGRRGLVPGAEPPPMYVAGKAAVETGEGGGGGRDAGAEEEQEEEQEATVKDLDADMDSYFGAPEAAEAAEPAETTDAAAVRALAPRTLACHLICPSCRCSRALLCPCHLKGLR